MCTGAGTHNQGDLDPTSTQFAVMSTSTPSASATPVTVPMPTTGTGNQGATPHDGTVYGT